MSLLPSLDWLFYIWLGAHFLCVLLLFTVDFLGAKIGVVG